MQPEREIAVTLRERHLKAADGIVERMLGEDAAVRIDDADAEVGEPLPLLRRHGDVHYGCPGPGRRGERGEHDVAAPAADRITALRPAQHHAHLGVHRRAGRRSGSAPPPWPASRFGEDAERRVVHPHGYRGAAERETDRIGFVHALDHVAAVHPERRRRRCRRRPGAGRRRGTASRPARAAPRWPTGADSRWPRGPRTAGRCPLPGTRADAAGLEPSGAGRAPRWRRDAAPRPCSPAETPVRRWCRPASRSPWRCERPAPAAARQR